MNSVKNFALPNKKYFYKVNCKTSCVKSNNKICIITSTYVKLSKHKNIFTNFVKFICTLNIFFFKFVLVLQKKSKK